MDKGTLEVMLRTKISPMLFHVAAFVFSYIIFVGTAPAYSQAQQAPTPLDSVHTKPSIAVNGDFSAEPKGFSPRTIKAAYNLSLSGGTGTVALITAYHYPTAEADLDRYNREFNLPPCAVGQCLEIHSMANGLKTDSTWSISSALNLQLAHAIAPKAKLLLIEARSDSGADLLEAVDYARSRFDVVSVAMGWGAPEFPDETPYADHFSEERIVFFASASQDKSTILWPAVMPDVVSVGGTSLSSSPGKTTSETAWAESGGGLSKYVKQPSHQMFAVPVPKGMRAVPDVSFDADPSPGVAIYVTQPGKSGWYQLGGTAVGTAAWAAIRALSDNQLNIRQLYADAMANSDAYFRDIIRGANGTGFYCQTGEGYDFITGLGSPITTAF